MEITPNLSIDDSLIEERFIRASGPGGQHVNKVSTAVQIRFDVDGCDAISDSARQRLKALAGTRVSRSGKLVFTANQHRSQRRNRDDARERLGRLIRRALIEPKVRKPKRRPSAAARRQRVEQKRRRSSTKQMRKSPPRD